MSFHIVVFMIGALSGEPMAPPLVVADPDFKSVAECETERTSENFKSSIEKLKKSIADADKDLPDFDFKTVCAKFDMRGKSVPSQDAGERL
jgi:hypothetical protein